MPVCARPILDAGPKVLARLRGVVDVAACKRSASTSRLRTASLQVVRPWQHVAILIALELGDWPHR
jgi:hypothetical protein